MAKSNFLLTCSLLGGLLGLIAHHGFFIHGEWHVRAPEIFLSHVFLFSLLTAGSILYHGSGTGSLFAAGLVTSICYLSVLLTSILVYRIWFHPLTRAGFKGPFYMRTSKIWHVWKVRTSKNHLLLDQIRKEYGDFVRTGETLPILISLTKRSPHSGPSEVTVFHPDVFLATDGSKTECYKAEWYDLLFPESSLLTTRDRALHSERRRQWKVCFSPHGEFNTILSN